MVLLMSAGAPLGNTNGRKKNRLLGDALKRQLTQQPEKVEAIAKQLIEDATSVQPDVRAEARKLLFERVDGKMPQAIVGDNDEPPLQIGRVVRHIIDPRKDWDSAGTQPPNG